MNIPITGQPFGTFMGMPVFVSTMATELRPRFPDKKRTKRRVRRVVGRYGSWMVRRPGAWRVGPSLVVHPEVFHQLQLHSRQNAAHSDIAIHAERI